MKRLLMLLLLLPALAQAGGTEQLKTFFRSTSAMKAQFLQVVTDAQGRKVQQVDGSMQLQRPGKFRWDYNKPFVQQIIGDGKRVWLYDPELNQVTVRDMGQALGSSPAALLAGSKEIENSFVLKDEKRSDGLEWVSATPKQQESGFERVLLGFAQGQLREVEMHDSFGHLTRIQFSSIEVNPGLTAQSFRFVVPAGADVVGE